MGYNYSYKYKDTEREEKMDKEKIILTGDRPTGKLHLGHYVGSLKNRVEIQNTGQFKKMYIMIADTQALTDNAGNVQKVRENVLEVLKDYLAVGIDPEKVTIFLQSKIPALTELTMYYMNLVTVNRLKRNPTIKTEIEQKGFEKSLPAGFFTYPISQAADITAFKANIVPVGEDQLPMIEQANEIVRKFSLNYGHGVLIEAKAVVPQNVQEGRLPGTDGKAKMSKSLGNTIYLSDDEKTIKEKVMKMYTDPEHIKVEMPGKVEGNTVFTYLDVFAKEEHFSKYLPEYENLDSLKAQYKRGGLGDVKVKKFLNEILQEIIAPIREKRNQFTNEDELWEILRKGTQKAIEDSEKTLEEVKKAMGIDYPKL